MRLFSCFSGIEAATVALGPLGFETVGLSEVEAFPNAVLEHHYPTVKNYGDITKHREWDLPGSVGICVGGPPCQSFSVSGLRKGMDDPRGNLSLTYLAFIDRVCPRWIIMENVPGLLSSNKGRDFGAILGSLAQLGYGFAYCVLDAQNFGVPQRRRRVFLVGHSGGCWQRPAAVLFNKESVFGDTAQGKQTGQRDPGNTEGGTGGGSQWPKSIAPTLPAAYASKAGLDDQHINDGAGLFVQDEIICSSGGQSNASYSKDVAPTLNRNKDGAPIIIPIHDKATRHKTNGGRGIGNGLGIGKPGDPAPTLTSGDKHDVYEGGGAGLVNTYEHHPQDSRIKECDRPSFHAKAGTGGGNLPLVSNQQQVRRLTPREAERLQGFPDDYTMIPYRGKPADKCPDGPRYKALGNSWAVPVVQWIGQRILEVDALKEVVVNLPAD